MGVPPEPDLLLLQPELWIPALVTMLQAASLPPPPEVGSLPPGPWSALQLELELLSSSPSSDHLDSSDKLAKGGGLCTSPEPGSPLHPPLVSPGQPFLFVKTSCPSGLPWVPPTLEGPLLTSPFPSWPGTTACAASRLSGQATLHHSSPEERL